MSAETGSRTPIRRSLISMTGSIIRALKSDLIIDREKNTIQIKLELDDSICSVMDYFEIFLERMLMCRRASEVLGCKFKLSANGSKLC